MADSYPYRPNVAMLVFRPATGLLWIGERAGEPNHWQFPQGGVDEGSSLEENVLRELVEELGATRDRFDAPIKLQATHKYDFSQPRAYGPVTYRGQSQTYWAVPYVGADSDFNLTAHEPEFQAWRWATPGEVRQIAAKKRLIGYEAALVEFEMLVRASKRKGI